ncbi:hypothetical protein [Maribacter litoralis]|uniref:Uncharacterized protein n=1 Tax=Maribacter litoralis TaxID=2059726 RepID=A0A653U5U3_9FLAO|nr:hypothetical protein [Maribacter litoralis]VXB88654.1 conserved hypothetical protein [Maribacter litoralis]
MDKQENFFDSKMIANLLIALALLLSAVYYIKNSNEIEDEVNSVLVSSLQDVSNSLAEETTNK